MAKDPIEDQTLPTRDAAERTAKLIGCTGAHKTPGGWQPCESHKLLMILIRRGAPAYRRARDGQKAAKRVITSQAVQVAIEEEEKRKRRKLRRRRYEPLGERGVTGIETTRAGLSSSPCCSD